MANLQWGELHTAVERELTIYQKNVTEKITTATKESMAELVKLTKSTAPIGERGKFKKGISSKQTGFGFTPTYTWYVKAPDYRLTHLLVHGHDTKDGGRTRPNYFLKNAVNTVLPKYEKTVEEAIKNAK